MPDNNNMIQAKEYAKKEISYFKETAESLTTVLGPELANSLTETIEALLIKAFQEGQVASLKEANASLKEANASLKEANESIG